MRSTFPARLVLALSLAAAPVLVLEPADLEGVWTSPVPQDMGQMHATGDFAFDGDEWRIDFRAFADPQASQPLFTATVGGTYVLGGPSEAVPGATEAVFHVSRRDLTAHGAAGAAMFAAMGCDIAADETRALVSGGCGFLPSMMEAGAEYDLVRVEDGVLTLGARDGDLSRARPAALAPAGYVRP